MTGLGDLQAPMWPSAGIHIVSSVRGVDDLQTAGKDCDSICLECAALGTSIDSRRDRGTEEICRCGAECNVRGVLGSAPGRRLLLLPPVSAGTKPMPGPGFTVKWRSRRSSAHT